MEDARKNRIAQGLARAASMSADALAALRGENDVFAQIKRNRERLDSCTRHDFEPQPDWWRQTGSLIDRKVHCRACGGEMPVGDAHCYLRGLAHGSGAAYADLVQAVWPVANGDS